jgi:hypothetical protein
MKDRLKDPDLARLFENTFPSTLDTTVSYFNADENIAFIITGVSVESSSTSTSDQKNLADNVGYHVCSHHNENIVRHSYSYPAPNGFVILETNSPTSIDFYLMMRNYDYW